MALIKTIRFKNYKKFENFTVSCRDANVLVGPNNAGKSTTLDALRILDAVNRFALQNKPTLYDHPQIGACGSYNVSLGYLPITVENIVRDYGDDPAEIEVVLSNGSAFHIFVHPDQTIRAYLKTEAALPRKIVDYKKSFPLDIVVVPTLSALEHREALVRGKTLDKNRNTRLASRNFRNFVYETSDDEFQKFSEIVKEGWSDIEIKRPYISHLDGIINMLYRERSNASEVCWSGFGFQVWMQMAFQLLRANKESILVLDEPDIYLHADLQRKILHIAKSKFSQIFIATHSMEILNESDPGDVLSIDSEKTRAIRVNSDDGYRRLYSYLGTSENAEFARLAKADKIVFFEGKDKRIIRRFAEKIRLDPVFNDPKTVYLQAGGFSQWTRVKEVDWALQNIFKLKVKIGAIFDRDYRSDGEINNFIADMRNDQLWVDVLSRKEIENYLLIPDVIARVISSQAKKRGLNLTAESVEIILEEVSDKFKSDVHSQSIANYIRYVGERERAIDTSTHIANANKLFEAGWLELGKRLQRVPGKDFISSLSDVLQKRYKFSITNTQIINEMKPGEVPSDLVRTLSSLEQFLLN